MKAAKTLAAINRTLEQKQDLSFRRHLGASVIGRACNRELWYIFRWARRVRHDGRMLRLFARGHLEETRFATWLMNAGINVSLRDSQTKTQHRVTAFEEHFGGSMDGKLSGVPDLPQDEVAVGEFKTHNEKSYKRLQKEGVAGAKWEHYVQMQVYMHLSGLRYALYLAINKNDDDLYAEIVEYNREIAEEHMDRAGKIILARTPPAKINESPGWYQCKFCDMKPVCHDGEPLAVNCRTCVHSRPVAGGKWWCERYNCERTHEEQLAACASYETIH